MRRYYSHFSFIYPDVFIKNCIIELDENSCIIRYYPYVSEIEKTEFYSGTLLFLPDDIIAHHIKFPSISAYMNVKDTYLYIDKNQSYIVYSQFNLNRPLN